MKVLVTGGAGKVGQWVIRALLDGAGQQSPHEVTVLDRVSEPLCDLLPRLMPAVRDKARCLTGTKPAVSNARIKELLGWRPVYSWRSDH